MGHTRLTDLHLQVLILHISQLLHISDVDEANHRTILVIENHFLL